MFNDLISVIVPAFNVANYIEKCVASLVNQTYKNIEIVVVDDCSTDDTYNVCLKLKNTNRKLVLLRNDTNRGLEITREKGIEASHGKWIMFLDADDTYSLDGVENCIDSLLAEPDIVFCPYARIINGKEMIVDCLLEENKYQLHEFCGHLLKDIKFDYLSCVGSKIYRRFFLLDNNIHFNKKYKFNEDGGFIIDGLKSAKSVYLNHVPFYRYNIRESGSIQSSYRPNMLLTIRNVYESLKCLLIDNDVFNGNTCTLFYKQKGSIFLDALDNEAKYSNFSSFKNVFRLIKNDCDYKAVCKALSKSKNKALFAMLICLKFNLRHLFYSLLRRRGNNNKR